MRRAVLLLSAALLVLMLYVVSRLALSEVAPLHPASPGKPTPYREMVKMRDAHYARMKAEDIKWEKIKMAEARKKGQIGPDGVPENGDYRPDWFIKRKPGATGLKDLAKKSRALDN